MGRILISNNPMWRDSLNERFVRAGFKENGSTRDIIVYDKLKARANNFLKISEEEFVACNGTLFYKDATGSSALSLLYNDYLEYEGDIKRIRNYCFGSFFVVIINKKQTVCFVDESGTYAMYYYSHDDSFLITNTYYHIESEVNESINQDACVEELLEYCIYDKETPFSNIFRIMPEDIISISSKDGTFSVVPCDVNYYTLKANGLDDVAYEIKEKIVKYTSKISALSMNPVIFMTGGVDSRLSLATYIAAGLKPVVCSWGGNKLKMNTKDEDVQISKELAQLFGLQFQEFDVSEDESILENVSKETLEKFGEWATIYGGNKKWFDIFNKLSEPVYEFGYFGETFKGWELLNSFPENGITINDFCELYTGRQKHAFDVNANFDWEIYKEKIHNKIRHMAESYGMHLDNLSKGDCMILYYRYRLHADTKCANLANVFGFSSPVLANKEIADLINQCPYSFKEKDKINLIVTNMIDNRFLGVQYFTHTHFMTLDRNHMVLVETKERNRRELLIGLLKKIGIYDVLKRIKAVSNSKRRDEQELLLRYATEINEFSCYKDMGLIVNNSTFNYIPLAVAMLCHSKMIDYALE